ncbi:MAG: rhodanese-like domain-containing protein [Candidatus Aminicenantes bacterium]|nr:rhodanese-like domain-containing protein [Candidatus Aminicenantes bacterium]
MHQEKLFQQIVFILILSSILGLGANFPLVEKYFQGEFQHGFLSLEEYPSITFITLLEAQELFLKGEALFIDSRNEEAFKTGHILKAKNIPFVKYKEKGFMKLLSHPLEETLVVYCDGSECQTSEELAKLLHKKGFEDIRIFFGGWTEWMKKRLPVSKESDTQ